MGGSVLRFAVCATAGLLAVSGASRIADAQRVSPLPIKRTLTGVPVASASSCPTFTPPPEAQREPSAEARRFTALAHEAALAGDQRTARDLFAQAAALAPADERVAYHLGRAYEDLGENGNAVRQYCRYLGLAPAAADSADVRTRITKLAPNTAPPPSPARVGFDAALASYDRQQMTAAAEGFGSVIRIAPEAPEPYFDRAIVLAAREDRAGAAADFRKYLELRPSAGDAEAVRTEIRRLEMKAKSVPGAFAMGLVLPGSGQFYTGHPWRGTLVLAAFAGAAVYSQDRIDLYVPCNYNGDTRPAPGGGCVTDHYPHYTAGAFAAAGVALAGAIEAAFAAHRRNVERSAGSTVARRTSRVEVGAPVLAADGRSIGVSMPLRF
jgi:Tfp pilus assembly protein PilF